MLALSDLFEYLSYGSKTNGHILILSTWGPVRFHTSESDVYIRQILTYKAGLRAERSEIFLLVTVNSITMLWEIDMYHFSRLFVSHIFSEWF